MSETTRDASTLDDDDENFTHRYPCGCEWLEGALISSCPEADRLWRKVRERNGLVFSYRAYRAHYLGQGRSDDT